MAEVSTIPAYVLSNENLLNWMLRVPLRYPFQVKNRDYLRELVYVDFHRWNTARPDHVFRHRWENFCYSYRRQQGGPGVDPPFAMHSGECSLVLACLECLKDEYIELTHGGLHVRMEHFGWWQNMLSRMSSLPVQAHAMWRTKETHPGMAGYVESLPLTLYPYDEGVDHYVSHHGLNDSHLHVNLVAGAEICWLNALTFPEQEWQEQQRHFDTIPEVVELYREVHVDLTPDILHRRMLIARRLRFLLQAYAEDRTFTVRRQCRGAENPQSSGADPKPAELCVLSLPQYLEQLGDLSPESWTDEEVDADEAIPACASLHGLYHVPDVISERKMLARVLEKLSYDAYPLVDRVLHLYLLLFNEFHTFCVQRDNLYGFKQFQKYSHIVSSITKSAYYYDHVFRTLHGGGRNSITNYAELRIAPRGDEKGNMQRIGGILCGYFHYLQWVLHRGGVADTSEMDMEPLLLRLNELLQHHEMKVRVVRPVIVLHLIKQGWHFKPGSGDVRYAALRRSNQHILSVWEKLFNKYPLLRKWVRGIDAAADEMDAPPDVFAVAYRTARNVLGLRHATYHAGEDFYHLISGIRNIYDAVHLLDFQRGDRIGHATALGVNPSLWLGTMPRCVTPTRGEWLQDLVFLWNLLHDCDGYHEVSRRLNRDIMDLGYEIFGQSDLSPHTLNRVFSLRTLDPELMAEVYRQGEADVLRELGESTEGKKTCIIPQKRDLVRLVALHIAQQKSSRRQYHRERQLVCRAFARETPEVLSLLLQWQGEEAVLGRASVRCEVPADYLSVGELVFIQQKVMEILTRRGVVLETLPTSNLRIGQYKEMGQHHSLRWLGIGAQEGDCPPPIVLGTDDPGVFATDIQAEFYHLFASLCKRGLNAQEALSLMASVNENGNLYAFRPLADNDTEDEALNLTEAGKA